MKSVRSAFAHYRSTREFVISPGHFPGEIQDHLHHSIVEKYWIEWFRLRDFRSLSNLSKTFERLVLSRTLPDVSSSPNCNPLQSAYHRRHSFETALLKMTNDICKAMDSSRSTIMISWYVVSFGYDRPRRTFTAIATLVWYRLNCAGLDSIPISTTVVRMSINDIDICYWRKARLFRRPTTFHTVRCTSEEGHDVLRHTAPPVHRLHLSLHLRQQRRWVIGESRPSMHCGRFILLAVAQRPSTWQSKSEVIYFSISCQLSSGLL